MTAASFQMFAKKLVGRFTGLLRSVAPQEVSFALVFMQSDIRATLLKMISSFACPIQIDDFIIGIAGRGEMVLEATSGDTSFINDPQLDISNPSQFNPEILVGPYQFEIRGAQQFFES